MDDRASQIRMRSLFNEGFSVMDLAEPLVSFDGEKDAVEAGAILEARGRDVAGVRLDGSIAGYARRTDLSSGACEEKMRTFDEGEVLLSTAPLNEVISALTRTDPCFVLVLGAVDAVVRRSDLEKPASRMWLFGMVTIIEMSMVQTMLERFPDDSWRASLSEGRLQKAEELHEERLRRGHAVELIDCLQFSDKAQILTRSPEFLEDTQFQSRSKALEAIKQLETLRNHLAHSQEIVGVGWEAIVMIAGRFDRIMSRL